MTPKTDGLRFEIHPIVRSWNSTCKAVMADGTVCGRWYHKVVDCNGRSYLRHSPRPYYNTHEMQRRRRR